MSKGDARAVLGVCGPERAESTHVRLSGSSHATMIRSEFDNTRTSHELANSTDSGLDMHSLTVHTPRNKVAATEPGRCMVLEEDIKLIR